MSEKLKDFEEMEVWQDARMLAVDVYSDFSRAKDFSFCDQIKRAVVSISNNIAEGCGRTTKVEFARFLDIAKGSSAEVRSMYRVAESIGFVSKELGDERCQQCTSISKQLSGFARYLRK
jgi:four helix bundle protein